MADPDDIPPICGESDTRSTGRKGRRGTMMREVTARRGSNQRIPIDFDDNLDPIGPMAVKFKSFAAVTARTRASILIDSWKNVPQGVKDQIWETYLVSIFLRHLFAFTLF